MKKAFTLIELLVVIAIIAILAAILFPVFAQAKVAAKKSVSISNMKQQNLSLFMYAGDYYDLYPHNDDCIVNSSLDPIYNGFVGTPTTADLTAHCNAPAVQGGFSWRVNHYAWQKWVLPYVKSTGLFYHPTIALLKGTGATNGVPTGFDQGEIANGYALNMAGKRRSLHRKRSYPQLLRWRHPDQPRLSCRSDDPHGAVVLPCDRRCDDSCIRNGCDQLPARDQGALVRHVLQEQRNLQSCDLFHGSHR